MRPRGYWMLSSSPGPSPGPTLQRSGSGTKDKARCRTLSWLVIPCVLLAPSIALAADPPGVEDLRARLAEVRARVEAEREAAEKQRKESEAAIAEGVAKRDALAAEVLDLELERLRLVREREASQAAAASVDVEVLGEALDDALAAARDAAEAGAILTRELPGRDAEASSLDAAARTLADGARADRARAAADVAVRLLALVEDARRVSVREVELRTAEGALERVELLSVGHVGFAYRVPGTERVGLTLESPADAEGYRWTEAVGGTERDLVAGALSAASGGRGARAILVPLDPSGRLELRTRDGLESLRSWIVAGGPVMAPIIALGVIAVLIALERAIALLRAKGHGAARLEPLLEACQRGDLALVERQLEGRRGAVARTIVAGLRACHVSQEAMEDAIQEQLLKEQPRLTRRLRGLAVIAAVAPLLGLFGTVTGIIEAFSVIRFYGNTEPGMMAGGIAEALVTTAAGLVVAIPALLLHSVLSGRAEAALGDAERAAASVLCAWRERTDEPRGEGASC